MQHYSLKSFIYQMGYGFSFCFYFLQGGIPPSVLASPSILANTSWPSPGSFTSTPTRKTPLKSPRTPDLGSFDSTRKALSQLQEEYTEYKQDVLENNKWVSILYLSWIFWYGVSTD